MSFIYNVVTWVLSHTSAYVSNDLRILFSKIYPNFFFVREFHWSQYLVTFENCVICHRVLSNTFFAYMCKPTNDMNFLDENKSFRLNKIKSNQIIKSKSLFPVSPSSPPTPFLQTNLPLQLSPTTTTLRRLFRPPPFSTRRGLGEGTCWWDRQV